MKILLTGGSGLLGQELQKYIDCFAPSHSELDIIKPVFANQDKDVDMVIHCAAYTDVAKAEKEKELCYKVNVLGTMNMLNAFPNAKFVFISSEYVKNPVNFYSYTKFEAESLVRKKSDYLIIRTLFKPSPWPYDVAFIDQYTEGDYVDIIAPLIIAAILRGDRYTIDIGTGKKTMFQLARRTNPKVLGNLVADYEEITGVKLPRNYV